MNIFAVDDNPEKAAHDLCDRHVVKMILESAQLLSTVCHAHGRPAHYRATHPHHPCTRWTGASAENYAWLHAHLMGLLAEYTRRYGKTHKVEREGIADALWQERPALPALGLTPFAQAMPEIYRRSDDPVGAYRAYYQGAKREIARWRHSETPAWFRPDEDAADGARAIER